jgi:hypothetical protein
MGAATGPMASMREIRLAHSAALSTSSMVQKGDWLI